MDDNKMQLELYSKLITLMSSIIFYINVIFDILSIFFENGFDISISKKIDINVLGGSVSFFSSILFIIFLGSKRFKMWYWKFSSKQNETTAVADAISFSGILVFAIEKTVLAFIGSNKENKFWGIFLLLLFLFFPTYMIIICLRKNKKERKVILEKSAKYAEELKYILTRYLNYRYDTIKTEEILSKDWRSPIILSLGLQYTLVQNESCIKDKIVCLYNNLKGLNINDLIDNYISYRFHTMDEALIYVENVTDELKVILDEKGVQFGHQ